MRNGTTAHTVKLARHGVVESVNVGVPRTVTWRGDAVTTSIWKAPVDDRVHVHGINVAGDDQADRAVHGGVDKAVYAYSAEDYDWWSEQLDHLLEPGTFGDNLTVRGLSTTDAVIGERWRIGSLVLEVSQPRIPCYKLGIRMSDPRFVKRFARAGRPGTYLRIVEPGQIGAGDRIQIEHRPEHGLTAGDVSRIYFRDRGEVGRLLEAPELAASWQDWAGSLRGQRA